MQTGNAEQPRLGMSKGGHIQCMAEGGLVEKLKAGVNRLVGNNPDAMKQRGRDPDAVDAPPPAPEAKAPKIDFFKKATGGKIPKPPKGQPKHPEATGTDTVPIMGTPGEFMVKKAAVDKLGVDFMEKINSVADGDKPKLGKVKRKRRGKRKPMADGGLLRLPAPTPGTAVATTPYRPNFTIPPQQPPAAPLALPAPALPQAEVQRQPWQGRRGASPEATAWQASRAPQAAPTAAAPPTQLGRVARVASRAAAPAGAALAAVPEVLDTAQVAMNPNATGIDVGTQAAQGAARIAGAGLGAATGAGLGALTGPAAPIAVPLGALAGGAYGYYAADKAIEGGRTMAGSDPAAPAARLGEVARPATVPAAAVPVRPATGAGAGQQLGASRDFTNELAAVPAQLPAGLRLGVINKTQGRNGTTVYSGKDVGPGAMMVDGKGAATASRGTVNSIDTSAGYAQDQRDLAAGTGGGGQALADARRAAVARGDIDAVKASYGGNFGPKVDPVDALVNNGRPMTARKAAAIAQLIAARDQSAVADLTNREKKGLLSAQDAYANAKTPAEKAAAEDRLRALQGKYEKAPPDEYAAVAGGVDANGNRTDPLIYSKRTGEVRNGQQAGLPPGMTRQVGTANGKPVYEDKSGKRFIGG